MVQKIQGSQFDFSGGQVDPDEKRNDDSPLRKTGARQAVNFRILSSKTLKNRSGRRALFIENVRVDEVLMAPGQVFYLAFGNGYVRVYNAAGTQLLNTGTLWTAATAKNLTWTLVQGATLSIFIAYTDGFPGNRPVVLTWDGVSQTSTWAATPFTEAFGASGAKRTPFYRIAPPGITLLPSANTGTINITFSSAVLTAGMVGTRMTFCGKQIQIATVTGPTTGTATVIELLFPGQSVSNTLGANAAQYFYIGDEVIGQTSGAKGIVTGFSGVGTPTLQIQLLSTTIFGGATAVAELLVGPNGSLGMQAFTAAQPPFAVTIWAQEVMNDYRGWPSSVFFDQNRLGFCNFPSTPSGIAWGSIGLNDDFYVVAESTTITAASAIFELVPNKSQVQHVVAGAESSEFIFCDNEVYYIPITEANPLKPGSVAFNVLSDEGSAANVQPRRLQDYILYVNAGLASLLAVVATGALTRPYEVLNLTTHHHELVNAPIAIAAPGTTSQFDERYAYFLNVDGTVTVGNYKIENGQIKGSIGWVPFTGAGDVTWLSARASNILFTTTYSLTGAAPVSLVEVLDETQYLDCSILVNAPPASFTPPGGKGPLWFVEGGTVTLMDQGTRIMGTYQVDANGFLVPQFRGGEDLTLASLVAGQPWTAILEPFAPDANSGQYVGQRMFRRRVCRLAVYVMNSTGFVMARLFSGPLTPSSPALGTVMNNYRVPTWNQGDNPLLPPFQREEVQRSRPIGRSFDPRVAIIKDTPGPLIVAEIGMENTI